MTRKIHQRQGLLRATYFDLFDEFYLQHLTPEHLDRTMAAIRRAGFHRLYWLHINEHTGGYGHCRPDSSIVQANLPLRGRMLAMGRDAAKSHGLEFHVTFKPYEAAPGIIRGHVGEPAPKHEDLPLLKHPSWQLFHRLPPDYEQLVRQPLSRLVLHFLPKQGLKALAPRLRLLGSRDNLTYEPIPNLPRPRARLVRYRLTDYFGRPQNHEDGMALRVEWDALNLGPEWKFLAITGPDANWATLPCPWTLAQDRRGRDLPLSYAGAPVLPLQAQGESNGAMPRFRFDCWSYGLGTDLQHAIPIHAGLPFAIARERNAAWAGSYCEAEPGVRRAWTREIETILAVKPDGVELRLQAHSMSSDDPFALTQNGALDRALDRRGIDPEDVVAVMRARADIFLRWALTVKRRVQAAGIPLTLPQQSFWVNPDPSRLCLNSQPKLWPAWTQWVDAADEVMLRDHFYQAYAPSHAFAAKARARRLRKPVWLQLFAAQAGGHLRPDIVDEVLADPLLTGVVAYEWLSIRSRTDPYQLQKACRPALARLGVGG